MEAEEAEEGVALFEVAFEETLFVARTRTMRSGGWRIVLDHETFKVAGVLLRPSFAIGPSAGSGLAAVGPRSAGGDSTTLV